MFFVMIMMFSLLFFSCLFSILANICWVVALTRQLECVLKLSNLLDMDQHLSIQETISVVTQAHNKDKSKELLSKDGGVHWIHLALDAIIKYGTVLDKVSPKLTFDRRQRNLTKGRKKYKPAGYNVYYLDHYLEDEGGASTFEGVVKGLIKESPGMASFTFSPTAQMDPIYNPSSEEVKAACDAHSVLLTGYGIDDNGTPYWEYQDSYGTSAGTNGGYWRVACGKNLINYVVKMLLPKEMKEPVNKKRKIKR